MKATVCATAIALVVCTAVLSGCSGGDSPTNAAVEEPTQEAATAVTNVEGTNKSLSECFAGSSYSFDADLAIYAGEMSDRIEWSANDIETFLRGLGVNEYCDTFAVGDWTDTDWKQSSAAYTLGVGTVYDDDGPSTLLVVVCRGTKSTAEGVGDLLKGWPGEKTRRFLQRSVYDNVADFYDMVWEGVEALRARGALACLDGRLKILVTGHSLGGAAANMVGAWFSHGVHGGEWWSPLCTQADVYVYTFGAIKVLSKNANAEDGYENIHNVYNRYDSFGPEGNWAAMHVSDPKAKFGHTDEYDQLGREEETGFALGASTNNHNMSNYLRALRTDGVVECLSGAQVMGGEPSKEYDEDEGGFSIVGTWLSVGDYGFGQAQPGMEVMFDGQTANFYSPADSYRLLSGADGLELECTSAVFGDTLTFEVRVYDNDHISVFHGNKETELVRTSYEVPNVTSGVWGDANDWQGVSDGISDWFGV